MWYLTALLVTGGLLVQTPLAAGHVLRRHGAPSVAAGGEERSNPLLEDGEFPPLAKVRAEDARPAVEARLAGGKDKLAALEASMKMKMDASKDPLPYEVFVPHIQELYEYVSHPWDIVQHIKAVRDSKALRDVVSELQPKVTAFWQSVSQSKPIYDAFLRLKSSTKTFDALPEARQRIVQSELLSRQLGGVGLSGEDAKKFNAVQTKLGKLSQTFSNHALDARKGFNVTLTDKAATKGIPERALVAAAEGAKQNGHKDATAEKGPWLLTLDAPILGPVMSFAEDAELRKKMYYGFITLASKGSTDNSATILEILKLRQQEAELLGYKNYAELSAAQKMATNAQVHKLLGDLLTKAKASATADDKALQAFAKKEGHSADLMHWDRGFYVQKLQKAEYSIDAEEMRNYFPFSAVVQGVFHLSERLFDVTAEQVKDHPDSMWDKDVTLYRLIRNKKTIGHIFIDPYSRPGQKRAGAWLQPMVTRSRTEKGLRLPVGSVQANFPAPSADGKKPSLLSLGECDTLFHEFGHALQHVMTTQDDAAVSGISGVEWDAVEIASQFMEYWIHFDKKTLYSFAKHWQTGAPLPEEEYQRLLKVHDFRAGTVMTSQVYMSRVDMRLHEKYVDGEDPNAIEKEIAKETLPVQPLPQARPLNVFSHIFSGGYAAGYYSYKWSEVLSADAFSVFDAGGALEDDSKAHAIGQKFASTLLALGGGRAPGSVFKDFVGRAPNTDALLKYQGLSGDRGQVTASRTVSEHTTSKLLKSEVVSAKATKVASLRQQQ